MSSKSQYSFRSTILILFSFFITLNSNGQDLVFSQYQKAPLLLNPAFTGISHYPFISLNHRNQWPEFDKAYISYSASYNQYIENLRSGFGIQLLADQQADGLLNTNSIGLYYSYTLQFLNDYRLKMGIAGVFGQTRLDWERLVFSDAIHPVYGPNGSLVSTEIRPLNTNKGYFDIQTGFLFHNDTWFIGVGLFHLNNPNVGYTLNSNSIFGLPLRFSAHAGYEFTLRENKKGFDTFLQPLVLVTNQAGFFQINTGIYGQFTSILSGLSFRHTVNNQDAIIGMVGYKFEIMELTYSYDLTISQLGRSGGSHEVGLVFDLSSLYPPKSNLNDCLKLFR